MRTPSDSGFASRLRSAAVAARVGTWLGVCFLVAFVTGLVSHYAQAHSQPVPFPVSPAWGYRITQGVHVAAGTAAVPLLLVKLWTVYPLLFRRLPRGRARALVLEGLERGSIAVLVAAAIFQLATGLANSAQWYPWSFSFRSSHYAVAWVAVGALLVHVAVKLPVVRDAWRTDVDDTAHDRPAAVEAGTLTRRGLLRTTWLAAGVAVVATAASGVPGLRRASVLAVRSGEGPGGVPINRSAEVAGVTAAAVGPSYRLEVVHGERSVLLSRADLEEMRQASEVLPIACVEGWSASGTWTGVRLQDLLALVGAPAHSAVRLTSLQTRYAFGTSTLPAQFAADPRTLIALGLSGEDLALDHGYPCRLIAPDRPGVLQTKWVRRIEVLS